MIDACLVNLDNYRHVRLPTLYQEQTHLTKYSRYRDDLGRREFWPETVHRYCHFMFNHIYHNFGYLISEETQIEIYEGILFLLIMPSMRAMMTAGPALERDHASAYNCSYAPCDRIETHDEAFYLTMCSVGVGFSVERQYTNQMPFLPDELVDKSDYRLVVEDDKIGWCKSFHQLLELLYQGVVPSWDTSLVRKKGERLMTFGGRASGPEPLEDLFNHTVALFRAAVDADLRRLTSYDNHDLMTKASDVANSGGVRRGAEISLSNPSDERMRDAKSGRWYETKPHFRLANNSAVWTDMPSATQFADEWLALIRSQAGERGQISRRALIDQARRARRIDVDKWGDHYGLNPCFAAGTLIPTDRGAFPIEDLVGQKVTIFNGWTWQEIDTFRETGHNQPMLKLSLRDGSEVRVTPYHKMILDDGSEVEAGNLKVGNKLQLSNLCYDGPMSTRAAYLKGFLLGDGHLVQGSRPGLFLYRPKFMCRNRLIASANELPVTFMSGSTVREIGFKDGDDRMSMTGLAARREELEGWCGTYRTTLPEEAYRWSFACKAEFLAGFFDADGCVVDGDNGFSYQLSSISRQLLLDVQTLLKSMGVMSNVSLMKKAGVGIQGYETQDCWRLTIGQAGSLEFAKQVKFARLPSFADRKVTYNVKPRMNEVVKIEEDGVDDVVYCCTVPGRHKVAIGIGIMTGNCGEIILRPRQFCNLTTNIIRANDGLRELLRKIRLSTILGTMQSTLTNFRYLQDDWRKNCEEERLLGVSLNGIFDNHFMSGLEYIRTGSYQTDAFMTDGVKHELPEVLGQMRDLAVETNRDWADRIGINPSAAITTVKPEGNNSNLVDCASGLHGRHAKHFYIRTNRANKVDPVGSYMITKGVYTEQDVMSDSSWVMYFPITVPEGAVTREDYTAMEHLQIWLLYQQHYCEHKPSVTISVKDREWMEVGGWVHKNFDWVSGIAFLPFDGGHYKQAPYITCNRQQFEEMVAKTPTSIDWSEFNEDSDYTEGAKELACMGGMCEL